MSNVMVRGREGNDDLPEGRRPLGHDDLPRAHGRQGLAVDHDGAEVAVRVLAPVLLVEGQHLGVGEGVVVVVGVK